MMTFQEKLQEIDRLQQQIEAAGKFSEEVRKKINYKFRLDWNYHSNSMEGNTLTLDETRSVMVNNLTIEGKPLRDVIEMRGHDNVVTEMLSVGKGETRLSERRIKDIHKAIVHEEDPEKQQAVGQWKIKPNYLYNYKKERFDFVAPELVAERIHTLLNTTNAVIDAIFAKKKDAMHPVTLAFWFHLEYVSIHPFYDGNGRTARIFSNLILIACGYPPLIIDTREKETYNRYLADIQAYGGAPDLFYGFLADKLMRSQQLVLDALAGKSIDEPSDIDKELSLFVLQATAIEPIGALKATKEIVFDTYQNSIKPLFKLIEEKHHTLDKLFAENIYFRSANDGNISSIPLDTFESLLAKLVEKKDNHIYNLAITIRHSAYQNNGMNMFSVIFKLMVYFGDYQYTIQNDNQVLATLTYSNPISYSQLEVIVSKFVKENLEEIKHRRKTE